MSSSSTVSLAPCARSSSIPRLFLGTSQGQLGTLKVARTQVPKVNFVKRLDCVVHSIDCFAVYVLYCSTMRFYAAPRFLRSCAPHCVCALASARHALVRGFPHLSLPLSLLHAPCFSTDSAALAPHSRHSAAAQLCCIAGAPVSSASRLLSLRRLLPIIQYASSISSWPVAGLSL
jgi:hypothetical protein